MKKIQVYHYDAFTENVGMGNPAGIIFNGDELTDVEMQLIAKQVGYNECAFLCSSEIADIKLRYFTPGHEMNLCGHGTVAAISALMEKNEILGIVRYTVETLAGIIEIEYNSKLKEVTMTQANPEFIDFTGDKNKLLNAIGLIKEDIDDRYPIVFGSTGTWTLIVPIKTIDSFYRMKPQNDLFPGILKEVPHSSIHPITLETIHKDNLMHGRHFSSPYSGTIEDPVTGTASGVMSAYYITYIEKINSMDMFIEQGQEIGKDGRVHAWVQRNDSKIDVRIAGSAIKVNQFEVII